MNEGLSHVIVAGAGVIGQYAALAYAERGIACTLLSPRFKDTASVEIPERIWSAPIVPVHTLRRLGVSDSNTSAITTAQSFGFPLGVGCVVETLYSRRYSREPVSLIDLDLTERSLFERVSRNPLISLRQSKVDSVLLEAGKVSGVRSGSEHIQGNLVIDATGRNAAVASSVNDIFKGSVSEQRVLQNSYISGGYLDLSDNAQLRAQFLYFGVSRQADAYWQLVPSFRVGSRATHLALIESSIAWRSFKDMEGTVGWDSLVGRRQITDRALRFNYREAVLRESSIPGLLLAGDAKQHVHPIAGAGIANGVWTVDALFFAGEGVTQEPVRSIHRKMWRRQLGFYSAIASYLKVMSVFRRI